MWDRGPCPRKLDDALGWRQNDEKARQMAEAALSLPAGHGATEKEVTRLLNVARGCFDFGGGYRADDEKLAIYHHGIGTVLAALEGAVAEPHAFHNRVLAGIGSMPGIPVTHTFASLRAEMVLQVGECCMGHDPMCSAGCLVERAVRRNALAAIRAGVSDPEVPREASPGPQGPVGATGPDQPG